METDMYDKEFEKYFEVDIEHQIGRASCRERV